MCKELGIFELFMHDMKRKFYEKLEEDDGRSRQPWEDYELDFLVARFLEEIEELLCDFPVIDWIYWHQHKEEIIEAMKKHGQTSEPADVGNFAMFIGNSLGIVPVALSDDLEVYWEQR